MQTFLKKLYFFRIFLYSRKEIGYFIDSYNYYFTSYYNLSIETPPDTVPAQIFPETSIAKALTLL